MRTFLLRIGNEMPLDLRLPRAPAQIIIGEVPKRAYSAEESDERARQVYFYVHRICQFGITSSLLQLSLPSLS